MPEKLVRDLIPAIVNAKDPTVTFRQASRDEIYDLLRKKLVEEATELAVATDINQLYAKLADVTEVLEVLMTTSPLAIRRFELDGLCEAQRREYGGFDGRWVLITPDPPSESTS